MIKAVLYDHDMPPCTGFALLGGSEKEIGLLYSRLSLAFGRSGDIRAAIRWYQRALACGTENIEFMDRIMEVFFDDTIAFNRYDYAFGKYVDVMVNRAWEQRRDLEWFLKETWSQQTLLRNMSRGKQCCNCLERKLELYICGRCRDRSERYCGKECFTKIWPVHKLECSKFVL